MQRRLPIANPCDADWSAMRGDERRRYCDACSKHVHHLDAMTREQILALFVRTLEDPSLELCVRFTPTADGELRLP